MTISVIIQFILVYLLVQGLFLFPKFSINHRWKESIEQKQSTWKLSLNFILIQNEIDEKLKIWAKHYLYHLPDNLALNHATLTNLDHYHLVTKYFRIVVVFIVQIGFVLLMINQILWLLQEAFGFVELLVKQNLLMKLTLCSPLSTKSCCGVRCLIKGFIGFTIIIEIVDTSRSVWMEKSPIWVFDDSV